MEILSVKNTGGTPMLPYAGKRIPNTASDKRGMGLLLVDRRTDAGCGGNCPKLRMLAKNCKLRPPVNFLAQPWSEFHGRRQTRDGFVRADGWAVCQKHGQFEMALGVARFELGDKPEVIFRFIEAPQRDQCPCQEPPRRHPGWRLLHAGAKRNLGGNRVAGFQRLDTPFPGAAQTVPPRPQERNTSREDEESPQGKCAVIHVRASRRIRGKPKFGPRPRNMLEPLESPSRLKPNPARPDFLIEGQQ